MAKSDKTADAILKGIALIGGGYAFVELLKLFGKKTTFYTCTKCKYDKLEYGEKICPNCKSHLEWPK